MKDFVRRWVLRRGYYREGGFAPLVVGLPRSGFSLTAAVLGHLFHRVPNKFGPRQRALRTFCETFGRQMSRSVDRAFAEHGKADLILFNDNFRMLVGGPIWNHDEPGVRAYFRKYIGVRGEGDFTLLTSHPIEVLDQYEIVHSHGPFSDWIDTPPFGDYLRFASVRNPVGIINSACHSINALASEYIQVVRPEMDVEHARQELATYKLTDVKFFNALLGPLKRGLTNQVDLAPRYNTVRWEDLIVSPRETIEGMIRTAGLRVSSHAARGIWKRIAYRNLTGAHKHNYRVGKAYVGDEREAVVNEHIDLMKEQGFDEIARFFGYGSLQYIDPKDYTPFQKRVSAAIARGEVLDPLEDRVLFDLAFNKSNVDFRAFDFRTYDWKGNTRLERSNIDDPALELAVWEAAESVVGVINELLGSLIDVLHGRGGFSDFESAARSVASAFPDVDVPGSIALIERELV